MAHRCLLVRIAGGGSRHFATMAKKKFALNLRYKDGRQLALEHFDFYYKPIFRRRWPSIRLGLTSRAKKCCVVNNFSANYDDVVGQFEADGAKDLVPMLEECQRRRIQNQKEDPTHSIKRREMRPIEEEEREEADIVEENTGEQQTRLEDARSAASLNQYVAPSKIITQETVPIWLEDDENAGKIPAHPWSPADVQFLSADDDVEDIVYPKYLRVFVRPIGDIGAFDQPISTDASSLLSHRIIDAANLFPVLALNVRPGESVLDLCAAPGDKAMSILQTMVPCNLVCNDSTWGRINLLKDSIRTYMGKGQVQGSIRFTRMHVDAPRLPAEHIGIYDKVLVDVPSTDDRRSLRAPDHEGNLFRRSRTEARLQIPDIQTNILIGGLKTVKRGGYLVYTTSTLSPTQNDEVVETALRTLKKRGGFGTPKTAAEDDDFEDLEFGVCDLRGLASDFYEAGVLRYARRQCRYGELIVPFLPNNYGPVYTCKLKRLE